MANKKDMMSAAGSAVFNKFFSSTDEQDTEKFSKGDSAKHQETAQKVQKKVFSFRGNQKSVTEWRVYADASGMKVDEIGTAAMEEYIKNHPLTEDQKKIFELKMKQK